MSGPNLIPSGLTSAKTSAELAAGVDSLSPQVTPATTLQLLSIEHGLFTDALLYTKLRLGSLNPYLEFCVSIGRSVPRQDVRSDRPFFSGLTAGGDPEWNHRIGLMPREHWRDFVTFMGQLAFRDRERDLLTRIRTQRIMVVDELELARHSHLPEPIPRVAVTAFVLDSNQGCAYFRIPDNTVLPTPYVYPDRNAYTDTEVFAQALLDEHRPDPYGLIDRVRSHHLQQPVEAAELQQRIQQSKEPPREGPDSVSDSGG